MKVASIGETDRGGAGLSSLKLHSEFVKQGIESNFFVNRKSTVLDSVIEIPNRKSRSGSPFRVGQYTPAGFDVPFTTGLSCKCEQYLSGVYEQYDVILLRWASVTVSDFLVSRWSQRLKPLVWCLSDMAPLTGGCHYSMGCDKYQINCLPCPRLESGFIQTPSLVLERRRRLWGDIVFVSPSKWLAEVATESAVTRDKDVRVIRTGVELDVFKPYQRMVEKVRLGLNPTKPVLLFGAASVNDSRKGYRFLPEIIGILNDKYNMRGQYSVLIIGANAPEHSALDCDLMVTGNISSREELARVYSSADITVLPYVEDNLPNVCLESIACDVPVVAFSIGGMPDLIEEGVNGALARPFDVWDLAYRIHALLTAKPTAGSIRVWAEANIDISEQARQYKLLFEELIDRKVSRYV